MPVFAFIIDPRLLTNALPYLAEDPAGEIQAFGKTWAFVRFDLWGGLFGGWQGEGVGSQNR